MGKQNTLRLNTGDAERRKAHDDGVGSIAEGPEDPDKDPGQVADDGPDGFNDDDTPLTWAEVRVAFLSLVSMFFLALLWLPLTCVDVHRLISTAQALIFLLSDRLPCCHRCCQHLVPSHTVVTL